MRRSTDRFLTTHAGGLPLPGGVAAPTSEAAVRELVVDVVARQREVGLDLVNEGELAKGGDWLSFADDRFAGFEERPLDGPPLIAQGEDRRAFADFYAYAAERRILFYAPGEQIVAAGFVLQVDDAWLPALWDRIGIAMGVDAFLDRCRLRIEALNHALRNVPEDRVRYH